MTIPIASPQVGEDERNQVLEVLDSSQLAHGEIVTQFEREFAGFVGTTEAIATSNGTTALHAALETTDLDSGNRVVTTPFTFVATANAIRFAGGEPVFADIDPNTFNVDPYDIEEIIRNEPEAFGAILAVHLYGLPAEMDHLQDIAEDYDLVLIEDAAQAHGAKYGSRHVGSIGDIGCFSFYPTKNMTTGEGGIITTDREDIASRARQFIDHGRGDGPYGHETLGHNFRMTNIAAAIGRAQLAKLPKFIEKRRDNAAFFTTELEDSPVDPPFVPPNVEHSYHQYTIKTDKRDILKDTLSIQDVQSRVYYPSCIHELAAYRAWSDSLPNAEATADRVLSLPVHPAVSQGDRETIVNAIRRSVASH